MPPRYEVLIPSIGYAIVKAKHPQGIRRLLFDKLKSLSKKDINRILYLCSTAYIGYINKKFFSSVILKRVKGLIL